GACGDRAEPDRGWRSGQKLGFCRAPCCALTRFSSPAATSALRPRSVAVPEPDRPMLNIVGCGHAARTLARLWAGTGPCAIGDVLTRSPASAQDAVRFIGQGRVV